MSNIPQELKYSKSHEWVKDNGDGTYTVGITDHAQEALGDIVYVESPEVGAELAAEAEAGVVESVKAASDIYTPVAGKIKSVNEKLQDEPQLLNSDPYGEGWLFVLEGVNKADVDALLSAADYEKEI